MPHQQVLGENGKSYVQGDVVAREFPRSELKPIVGNLNLIPIDDFLLEYAVSIAQPVSPSRVVESG